MHANKSVSELMTHPEKDIGEHFPFASGMIYLNLFFLVYRSGLEKTKQKTYVQHFSTLKWIPLFV